MKRAARGGCILRMQCDAMATLGWLPGSQVKSGKREEVALTASAYCPAGKRTPRGLARRWRFAICHLPFAIYLTPLLLLRHKPCRCRRWRRVDRAIGSEAPSGYDSPLARTTKLRHQNTRPSLLYSCACVLARHQKQPQNHGRCSTTDELTGPLPRKCRLNPTQRTMRSCDAFLRSPRGL
jgi:hypothetical protein